jgi:hypothetical protein
MVLLYYPLTVINSSRREDFLPFFISLFLYYFYFIARDEDTPKYISYILRYRSFEYYRESNCYRDVTLEFTISCPLVISRRMSTCYRADYDIVRTRLFR